MLFSLQATQRVRLSEERERWRGEEGVGKCLALREVRSTGSEGEKGVKLKGNGLQMKQELTQSVP